VTENDPKRPNRGRSSDTDVDQSAGVELAETVESLQGADTLISDDGGAGDATLEAMRATVDAQSRVLSAAGGVELVRGQTIDHFVVLERLGAGGMGVVVAAYDPNLDRRVAIKVLRPDVGEGGSRDRPTQRLLREAQAMAKLSHPNVVTVHEVGTVGEGVFVAMEFVEGQTLTRWLEAEDRPWREVADAFMAAGRGLAAAHEAGLVHRDFKPDNVLIGDDGRICVTDFGLVSSAGAVAEGEDGSADEQARLAEATALSASLTRTGALLGTPMYMAPEQHLRKPVDARADQFSFCVALYEALYGERPFEGDSYWDLAASVTSGEVKPPPTRAPVPTWLRAVVLRGLRPDPDARFPSMGELLAELAKDPEAARRRKQRIAGTAGLFAALASAAVIAVVRTGGSAPSVCADARAKLSGVWDESRRAAVHSAFAGTEVAHAESTFERVAAVLDGYADGWAALRSDACEATHVHGTQSGALLDLRMHCLDRLRARMNAVVNLFVNQPDDGVVDKAVQAVEGLPGVDRCNAIEALTDAVPPPDAPEARARVEAVEVRLDEAQALMAGGKVRRGLEVAMATMEEMRALDHSPLTADALFVIGSLQNRTGDASAAEKSLEEAVQAAAEARNDRLVARSWSKLVYVIGTKLARHDDALALRRTAEAAVARAGNGRELRADLHNNLGNVLWSKGEFDQAREQYEGAVTLWTELHGANHPDVANALNNLGAALGEQGKYAESKEHFTRALAVRERTLGPAHPYVATTLNNLAGTLFALGEYAESLPLHERALAIKKAAFGPDHPRVAQALNNIGNVLLSLKRLPEARSSLEEALVVWEKALGGDHPSVAQGLDNLGAVALAQGNHEEARGLHARALRILESSFGADDPALAWSLDNLGAVYLSEGKYDQAERHYERALSMFEKALGSDHPDTAQALTGIGACKLAKGKAELAIGRLERALAIRNAGGGDPSALAEVRFLLARALWVVGRGRDRAIDLAEKAHDAYADLGATSDKERSEIERWLEQHLLPGRQ